MQLRHMRAGNQINAAMSLMDKWSGPDYARGLDFVYDGGLDEKLKDPAFRADLEHPSINRGRHPEAAILGYWEQAGSLVKLGFIDESTFMNLSSLQCIAAWKKLNPVIAIMRRRRGPTVADNFEYLASRAMLWEARHANDQSFPSGTPHLQPQDLWPEDTQAQTPAT